MASSNSGSEALKAKIRAMYGGRLTQQDYKELIRKQSVYEVASYIKQQTSYAGLLKDVNENLIHRGQLEVTLKRRLFDEYVKIFHYVTQGELGFYNYLITRMEINEILSCIRFLNAGREGEYLFSLPSFFAKRSNVDLYALAKVKSFDELRTLLKDTRYNDILEAFDVKENNQVDINRIETEFDKFYYSRLLKGIDDVFSGEVKQKLRDSFGMGIDLGNISTIMRLKKYFNADNKYIRDLLVPYFFKLRQSDLDNMISAPDPESTWKAACETSYGEFFTENQFHFIEKYAQEILYRYHKKLIVTATSTPIVVVSYFALKNNELKNLISIIEGIRYGLEPSEIGKLLVGIGS